MTVELLKKGDRIEYTGIDGLWTGTIHEVDGYAYHVLRDDGVSGEFGMIVTGDMRCWMVWASDSRLRPLAAPMPTSGGLEALTRAWLEIGPNARRLLEYTAARLVVGKSYGDFDKPRDWDKDIAEEEFDAAMYRAAKHLGYGK